MKQNYFYLALFLMSIFSSNAQFTESFESILPSDWKVINNGDPNGWQRSVQGSDAYDGDYVMAITFNSQAHDDYLITKKFTVTSKDASRLSFAYKHRSNSFPEPFDVKLSTTGNEAADFTTTIASQVAPTTDWQVAEYDLSAYEGQEIYIAFYSSTQNKWELNIDAVKVDTKPTCEKPKSIATTALGVTDATISWQAGGSETTWEYEYGEKGFTLTGNATIVTNTTISLSGLKENTEYELYVKAKCGGKFGNSEWVLFSWTTLLTPPVNDACTGATVIAQLPFNETLNAEGATNNDGFIANCESGMNDGVWYTFTPTTTGTVDIEVAASLWNLELGLFTGECGTFTCVSSTDALQFGQGEKLTGVNVTAGTQYWINIGHWAGAFDGDEDEFTIDVKTTDTTTLGINSQTIEGFMAYPNPVKNSLKLDALETITKVEVVNLVGQTVLVTAPNTNKTIVNMNELNKGIYIVKVTVGAKTGNYKIVKE